MRGWGQNRSKIISLDDDDNDDDRKNEGWDKSYITQQLMYSK